MKFKKIKKKNLSVCGSKLKLYQNILIFFNLTTISMLGEKIKLKYCQNKIFLLHIMFKSKMINNISCPLLVYFLMPNTMNSPLLNKILG